MNNLNKQLSSLGGSIPSQNIACNVAVEKKKVLFDCVLDDITQDVENVLQLSSFIHERLRRFIVEVPTQTGEEKAQEAFPDGINQLNILHKNCNKQLNI